jgi:hypothetical protein
MKIRSVFATLALLTAVAPHVQAQSRRAAKSDAPTSTSATAPDNTPNP